MEWNRMGLDGIGCLGLGDSKTCPLYIINYINILTASWDVSMYTRAPW